MPINLDSKPHYFSGEYAEACTELENKMNYAHQNIFCKLQHGQIIMKKRKQKVVPVSQIICLISIFIMIIIDFK